MSLRDSLTSEKQKERYDRNYNSIEMIFTHKELEEHDKEIRDKAIDTFMIAIETHMKVVGNTYLEDIREIAEQMKEK